MTGKELIERVIQAVARTHTRSPILSHAEASAAIAATRTEAAEVLRRINRAANAILASDVECMSATIERVVREIAALSASSPAVAGGETFKPLMELDPGYLKLRFFRDIVQAQRDLIFMMLGVDADIIDEISSQHHERMLLAKLIEQGHGPAISAAITAFEFDKLQTIGREVMAEIDAEGAALTTTATASVEVGQGDRDRAADLAAKMAYVFEPKRIEMMRRGMLDDHPYVQAFRDHRLGISTSSGEDDK